MTTTLGADLKRGHKTMRKCLVCQAEYEVPKSRRLCCDNCDERVRNYPGQLLTVAERLWGKCYEKDQHWEYCAIRQDGRANPIMLERRQVPAAQVALILSGKPRPSPLHVARINCGNRACVRPDGGHIEWAEKRTGIELKWGKDLSREDLAAMVQLERDKRAKYQRDYRANLKRHDVRSMREVHDRELAEHITREAAFRETGRYTLPGGVAYVETPPEPKPEAITPPSGLLSTLANVPVDPSEYGV